MRLLENTQVRLRALEPEDLDLLYRWENNTEWWNVGNAITPYSRYILREYINESHKNIYDSHQLRLMIDLKESGKTIGTVDLFDFDPHHRHAGVGILIDSEYQQNGWACESLSLLIDYAFSFLKIHSLYAHIPVKNTVSIALFSKCGFTEAGYFKDWQMTVDGYSDVLIMQRINEHDK